MSTTKRRPPARRPRPATDPAAAAPSNAPPRAPVDPVEALGRALAGQLAAVRELGVRIEQLDTAIRAADVAAIQALVHAERDAVRRIESLDAAARRLAVAAARKVDPEHVHDPSVRRIAAAAGGDLGRRLAGLAESLPAEVARVRAAGEVVRTAAAALATHAGGLVGALRRAAGESTIYQAGGRHAETAPLERRVDLRT